MSPIGQPNGISLSIPKKNKQITLPSAVDNRPPFVTSFKDIENLTKKNNDSVGNGSNSVPFLE
jgi:hypothetical protein